MFKIAKVFIGILLVGTLFGFVGVPAANAQILPVVPANIDCNAQVKGEWKDAFIGKEGFVAAIQGDRNMLSSILGCAVKTGRIRLYMMPFFITYLIQFLLSLAGLIAVLFVVYGGFKYTVGGLVEDKESGKKVIKNALIGLVVALSSWMVINFIQIVLTR